jgi:hypothetical protein
MVRQHVIRRFSEPMRSIRPDMLEPAEALHFSDEAGSSGI